MSARAAVLTVLVAATARAETEVRAFTKDSTAVVYLVESWAGESVDTHAVVLDLRTGAQKTFELQQLEDGLDKTRKLTGLSPELDAWLKKHPTVPTSKSRTSPDGKATADLSAGEQATGGAWEGGGWKAVGKGGWQLQVVRDGKPRLAARCGGGASVAVHWSPDGKRTVWVVTHGATAMRDPGYEEVIVGTDGTPAVMVLAPNKAGLPAAEKLIDGLEKAGFPVLSVGAAKKERTDSVVYAAEGSEEQAKTLAAAIPGGATVQKLDWASAIDLVVALGPKAGAP